MNSRIFLEAKWKYLAMINYEIDPALLAAHIPTGTELDLWNGKAYVSLVGFMFLDTYIMGLPIPFHRDFEEVNLRFYIKRIMPNGDERRGVAFIKEIVPKWAIATVANSVYYENYISLPMRHVIIHDPNEIRAEYEWKHNKQWQRIAVTCSGEPELPPKNSDAEFFTEHYWGYSKKPNSETLEYQVEHPPWRVWDCKTCELDIDFLNLYGSDFAPFLKTPHSSFLAEGSPIIVRGAKKLFQ